MLKSIIVPLFIYIIIYVILNFSFEIPDDLKGWVMMSVFTPIISMFLNSYTIISIFKKMLCHSHSWDNQTSPDVISWIDHYVKTNTIWSQESITEIANNKSVIWWNTYNVDNRPQTREIPIGWCIIKYKNGYILSYAPYPTARKLHFATEIDKSITIYSFYKINWDEFINHVKDHYYNKIISSRMITYNCNSNGYTWSDNCLDLRPDVNKSYCFGNKAKEDCWDAVLKFFDPKTKERYRHLGQTYKTSFLIHGPPGTGKSEMILLIASSLWKKLQIPVYMLNPNGLSDSMLQSMINEISTGIVVVNEFDMGIKIDKKMKKKMRESNNPTSDNDTDDEENPYDRSSRMPSITAWHNVMDSVPGEVLFWFTTNNFEYLKNINHGSLVRKGRIDHIFEFNTITDDEIRRIVNKFSPDADLEGIPSGLTIADVIANIKFNGKFIPEYSLD